MLHLLPLHGATASSGRFHLYAEPAMHAVTAVHALPAAAVVACLLAWLRFLLRTLDAALACPAWCNSSSAGCGMHAEPAVPAVTAVHALLAVVVAGLLAWLRLLFLTLDAAPACPAPKLRKISNVCCACCARSACGCWCRLPPCRVATPVPGPVCCTCLPCTVQLQAQ